MWLAPGVQFFLSGTNDAVISRVLRCNEANSIFVRIRPNVALVCELFHVPGSRWGAAQAGPRHMEKSIN